MSFIGRFYERFRIAIIPPLKCECSFSCLHFFRIRSVQDLQNSIDWMDRLMLNENIFFEIAGQINILAISQMVWLEF